MAAEQQQLEGVVPVVILGDRRGRLEHRVTFFATRPRRVAAHAVDIPALGDREQPAERALGNLLPRQVRIYERLLDRVLATIEVAMAPDERGQHLWCLLTLSVISGLRKTS